MGRLINFPQQQAVNVTGVTPPEATLSPEARCALARSLVSEAAELLSDLGGSATELSWLLEDYLGLLNQFGRNTAIGR